MEHPKNAYRWVIVFLWFFVYFFSASALFCMPPLFSEIGNDIPLTKAQMGIIFGMNPLASLFLGFIAGSFSDRFGSRWVVGIALLLTALSGALRAVSVSAFELMVYSFIMGVGTAFLAPNSPKVLGMWFPREELGKANGIVMAAIPLAGAFSTATSASFMSPVFGGWKGVVIAFACMCMVMTIIWMLLYREGDAQGAVEKRKQAILSNFGNVLKVRDIWLVAFFFGLYLAATGTVTALLPVILEERGVSRPGEIVSIWMWVGIVSTALGGVASDKLGRRKPFLIGAAIVMAIGLPLLSGVQGMALIATLVLLGIAAGTLAPLKTVLAVEIKGIGPSLAATAFGFMMMVGFALSFLGPSVSGKLMDMTESSFSAFLLMAVCMLVAAGIAVALKETGKRAGG